MELDEHISLAIFVNIASLCNKIRTCWFKISFTVKLQPDAVDQLLQNLRGQLYIQGWFQEKVSCCVMIYIKTKTVGQKCPRNNPIDWFFLKSVGYNQQQNHLVKMHKVFLNYYFVLQLRNSLTNIIWIPVPKSGLSVPHCHPVVQEDGGEEGSKREADLFLTHGSIPNTLKCRSFFVLFCFVFLVVVQDLQLLSDKIHFSLVRPYI